MCCLSVTYVLMLFTYVFEFCFAHNLFFNSMIFRLCSVGYEYRFCKENGEFCVDKYDIMCSFCKTILVCFCLVYFFSILLNNKLWGALQAAHNFLYWSISIQIFYCLSILLLYNVLCIDICQQNHMKNKLIQKNIIPNLDQMYIHQSMIIMMTMLLKD